MSTWNDNSPIYLQLRALVVARILTGALAEGQVVPSVRQVAADEKINPLTVSKAYQALVDEGLLEKRRGLGMFVREGARAAALQTERERFIQKEWPAVCARVANLGLNLEDLIKEPRA